MDQTTAALTTEAAVGAIAYERAPRHPGRSVNRRVVCADGFLVSVQASPQHYANDSSDEAPYWKTSPEPGQMVGVAYPFTTFEVGNPSSDPTPSAVWDQYDSDGVWSWVPSQVVADLLDAHGGAVAWEATR
jgi:hypothetical protein